MRNIKSKIIGATMLFGLVACGGDKQENTNVSEPEPTLVEEKVRTVNLRDKYKLPSIGEIAEFSPVSDTCTIIVVMSTSIRSSGYSIPAMTSVSYTNPNCLPKPVLNN